MQIDAYHPLASTDHEDSCAGLCANWNALTGDNDGCFENHPDVSVAEAM
jgi:hypothetical protein